MKAIRPKEIGKVDLGEGWVRAVDIRLGSPRYAVQWYVNGEFGQAYYDSKQGAMDAMADMARRFVLDQL